MKRSGLTPRWAPWWAYVIPFLALTYLRQALLPPAEVGDALSVALALATAAVVVVVVTGLRRRVGRPPGD